MCDKCKQNLEIVEITLVDRTGVRTYCPNCIAIECYYGIENTFQNSKKFTCDVTGKIGAMQFKSNDEEYFLDKEIMARLLKHDLKENEYFALAKKYGANKYMLHDDFYDPDTGEAFQPLEC